MGRIGRPAIGPRTALTLSEVQMDAIGRLADNRSEWIRRAIDAVLAKELTLLREGYRARLDLAQDRNSDLDAWVIVDLHGEEIDEYEPIEVEPSEEPWPYDEALAAAGWTLVVEGSTTVNPGDAVVMRTERSC